METGHVIQVLFLLLSCLLLVSARDAQDAAMNDVIHSQASQPQKRSVPDMPSVAVGAEADLPAIYSANALMDDLEPLSKRSSLFRFGKRGGSLFRFGKRGSLFRFGKRSSLFRFGKRGGALFRFGKRAHDDDDGGDYVFYPSAADEMPAEDLKREVKSFHWGRETEE